MHLSLTPTKSQAAAELSLDGFRRFSQPIDSIKGVPHDRAHNTIQHGFKVLTRTMLSTLLANSASLHFISAMTLFAVQPLILMIPTDRLLTKVLAQIVTAATDIGYVSTIGCATIALSCKSTVASNHTKVGSMVQAPYSQHSKLWLYELLIASLVCSLLSIAASMPVLLLSRTGYLSETSWVLLLLSRYFEGLLGVGLAQLSTSLFTVKAFEGDCEGSSELVRSHILASDITCSDVRAMWAPLLGLLLFFAIPAPPDAPGHTYAYRLMMLFNFYTASAVFGVAFCAVALSYLSNTHDAVWVWPLHQQQHREGEEEGEEIATARRRPTLSTAKAQPSGGCIDRKNGGSIAMDEDHSVMYRPPSSGFHYSGNDGGGAYSDASSSASGSAAALLTSSSPSYGAYADCRSSSSVYPIETMHTRQTDSQTHPSQKGSGRDGVAVGTLPLSGAIDGHHDTNGGAKESDGSGRDKSSTSEVSASHSRASSPASTAYDSEGRILTVQLLRSSGVAQIAKFKVRPDTQRLEGGVLQRPLCHNEQAPDTHTYRGRGTVHLVEIPMVAHPSQSRKLLFFHLFTAIEVLFNCVVWSMLWSLLPLALQENGLGLQKQRDLWLLLVPYGGGVLLAYTLADVAFINQRIRRYRTRCPLAANDIVGVSLGLSAVFLSVVFHVVEAAFELSGTTGIKWLFIFSVFLLGLGTCWFFSGSRGIAAESLADLFANTLSKGAMVGISASPGSRGQPWQPTITDTGNMTDSYRSVAVLHSLHNVAVALGRICGALLTGCLILYDPVQLPGTGTMKNNHGGTESGLWCGITTRSYVVTAYIVNRDNAYAHTSAVHVCRLHRAKYVSWLGVNFFMILVAAFLFALFATRKNYGGQVFALSTHEDNGPVRATESGAPLKSTAVADGVTYNGELFGIANTQAHNFTHREAVREGTKREQELHEIDLELGESKASLRADHPHRPREGRQCQSSSSPVVDRSETTTREQAGFSSSPASTLATTTIDVNRTQSPRSVSSRSALDSVNKELAMSYLRAHGQRAVYANRQMVTVDSSEGASSDDIYCDIEDL
jgi:hypothetical protein